MTRVLPPALLERGKQAEVRFHNILADNFMVFQDQLETNLLQLFAHP